MLMHKSKVFTEVKSMCTASTPLPRWKCHKEVYAFKITQISPPYGSTNGVSHVTQVDIHGSHGGRVTVMADWMEKHKPEIGGYFIRYDDGYESYSPTAPFEEGYVLLRHETHPAYVLHEAFQVNGVSEHPYPEWAHACILSCNDIPDVLFLVKHVASGELLPVHAGDWIAHSTKTGEVDVWSAQTTAEYRLGVGEAAFRELFY